MLSNLTNRQVLLINYNCKINKNSKKLVYTNLTKNNTKVTVQPIDVKTTSYYTINLPFQ